MTVKKPFSFTEAFDNAKKYPGLGVDETGVVMRSYIRFEMGDKDAKALALKAARDTAGLVSSGKAEVFVGEDGAPKIAVSVLGEPYTKPENEGLTPQDIKYKDAALFIASEASRQGNAVLAERAIESALKVQDPKAREVLFEKLRVELARFQAVEKLHPRFKGTECILALLASCPQLPKICEFVDDNVRFV